MSRPIEALFDGAALKHNYQIIQSRAPHSRAYAVIKANAYGHGVMRVAQALADADGFALLEISTAIELRRNFPDKPILLLEGVFSAAELALCAEHQLSIVLHSAQHLAWLDEAQQAIAVFIKLNTGMNRLGFPCEQAADLVARLRQHPRVAAITLMTHFATADDAEQGIAQQWEKFQAATQGLGLPLSLANSAAIFAYPEVQGDWVRPGLALYGASPFAGQSAASLGLKPVMTLRSKIIAVQSLQAGDTVGYGATFRASSAMRVGIVACGYADGYPRHAPTGTPVWVAGRKTRLLGRVSMDMLCVDLTAIDAGVDSEVELWGASIPIDDVASAAGTISYELMCAIAARVPVRDELRC